MVGWVVIAAVAAGTSACGSIVRGTSEQVAFVSNPPGASMTSDSKYACPATPCSIEVERTDAFNATFAKAGYTSETVPVQTKLVGAGAAGMAGNIIAGGIIGIGVDAATGAALDHTPNPVTVTLQPEGRPALASRARKRRERPPTT